MTNKKRQRASDHTPAKASLSQPQATEELQDILPHILHQLGPDILENLKKLAKQFQKNGNSASSGTNSRATGQPEDENNGMLEPEAVMPRVRRSAVKRKVNHELQDDDEVEDPRQEQNEEASQQPTEKRVMPRVRRSAIKRKVNHELEDDDDEVEDPRQERNEESSQQPTEKRAMAPKTQKTTANHNEHGQQQSRQPQTSQQQSMQQPHPQISEQASSEQGIAKRGPTYLLDVWARKPTEGRILVSFNKRSQPIGPNKKKLTGFLGTLARNGKFAPLDIEDWREVPKVRKDEMIKIVKERFEIPQGVEHWILKSIAKKRRHWRSRVKTECFKPEMPIQDQFYNRPGRVIEDQWENLLPYWTKEDVQEASAKNKDHRKLSVMQQTTGKLSFAEVEEELKEQLGRTPTRMEIFGACYSDASGEAVNVEVQDALTKMKEHQSKLPSGSQDKVGPNDSFAKVRGKDPDGRVRMLGLGVNPTDMWGDIPSRYACYRMVLENQEALARVEEKMDRVIADFRQKIQAQQNTNNISVPHPPTSPVQSSNSINLGRRLQVGEQVLLKSIFDSSKIVAKGFVRSIDPDQEVGGKRLGSNWYEVLVSCPFEWDEDLIRPFSEFSTVGDACGCCVAWPRNLVSHADDEG